MAIVEEAYSQENNINPTARKYEEYNVQPSQIRRWKKSMETLLGQSGMTEAKKESHFSRNYILVCLHVSKTCHLHRLDYLTFFGH